MKTNTYILLTQLILTFCLKFRDMIPNVLLIREFKSTTTRYFRSYQSHTCACQIISNSAKLIKKEYDQEIPQSHTADQPTAP